MNTPWGNADFIDYFGNSLDQRNETVIRVSTPSHGGIGIKVDAAENLYEISDYAKNVAIKSNGYYWFEEDCDWAIAVIELEVYDIFGPEMRNSAVICAENWHPEYLERTDAAETSA